jgi:hypothetical protein
MVAVNTTASLTGADQFSDAIELVGDMSLTISGTFAGTITVQRSFDEGSTWLDVDTFTRSPRKSVSNLPAASIGLASRLGITPAARQMSASMRTALGAMSDARP